MNVSSPNTPGLRALQQRDELEGLITSVLSARNQLAPTLKVYLAHTHTLITICGECILIKHAQLACAAATRGSGCAYHICTQSTRSLKKKGMLFARNHSQGMFFMHILLRKHSHACAFLLTYEYESVLMWLFPSGECPYW